MEFNGHRLFGLQIVPTGRCVGSVLYLPPFVEEMNRCRSHAATQARELAALGWHCLLLDPLGTGESEGDIADGRWDLWRADFAAAAAWLKQRRPDLPLALWGVRSGALMAADVARDAALSVQRLLFWQPVLDGKLFVNQHLRLRLASQMVSVGERETSEQLRSRLAAGELIEVAGYPFSGALADALARLRLADLLSGTPVPAIDWIEMAAKDEPALSPPSKTLVQSLEVAGLRLRAQAVTAPPIWQLYERERAPALMAATSQWMEVGA